MKPSPQMASAPEDSPLQKLFATVFGAYLGLALLKFGNPPIMERFVAAPTNMYEVVLGNPWPIKWAYVLLGAVVVSGVLAMRSNLGKRKRGPQEATRSKVFRWLVLSPLIWLVWQVIATFKTVDGELSGLTLAHFASCVACFYLGFFVLSQVRDLKGFWLGLLCGFLLVLVVGWQQQFGGLEETRQYFFTYIYPQLKVVSPDYIKKISSNRIFSTLFYPNALAGALLLLLPISLGMIWQAQGRFTLGARVFLLGVVGLAALGCLFWSGSKGGWLLMMMLGLITLLQLPLGQRFKIAIVAMVLVLGLAGFFWRYSGFFRKGATSVSARFDYWQAAVKTTQANPVFGTGPGTFSIPYQQIKRPESEMTRLVHNDYLEQASDSGLPGFVAYAVFIFGSLALTFRRFGQSVSDWPMFWIWLGVLGWAAQGFMEFGLYIPALAWLAFAFLGLLVGRWGQRVPRTGDWQGTADPVS